MKKTGIGLYGHNGHQINEQLKTLDTVYLAGVCDADGETKQFASLSDMLESSEIELVSLCSPNRGKQAEDVLRSLRAGKHVLAEKPCALTEEDLDSILDLATEKKLLFCEMDFSYFNQPYNQAMKLIKSGVIGDVVQVFCQKSYPYTDKRPQDESVDGGLLCQSALYGFRWVQNIAGQDIKYIRSLETTFSNPKGGGLRMAVSIQMELGNGGLATIIANYLNNQGTGSWGYEELRIFGTQGILRTDAKENCVYIYSDEDNQVIQCGNPAGCQLSCLVSSIQDNTPLYMDMCTMTMPTRFALRAKRAAELCSHNKTIPTS